MDQESSWGLRVVAISQPEKKNISILTINTARLVKQLILKEINLEYSLEGLMLKLKLQYFGHLMQRVNSLEKTLMLGKIEGKRRKGQQRMRWLDNITDPVEMNVSKLQQIVDFPGSSAGKESACNAGDPGLIPGSGQYPGEGIGYPLQYSWASLVAQMVEKLPAIVRPGFDPWVRKIPLEKGMATRSSRIAWRIPWIEEPGMMQPTELQKVKHNLATEH